MLTVRQSVFCYAIYNAYLHPLRRYPGPLLWRSFRVPYVVSTQRGNLHNRLTHFHTKYGPIVRIAPNELSYADSAAWKDIYLDRSGHPVFERNPTWFKKMRPDEPNSIMGPDEKDHARFRRAFANSFSDKSLKDQAPVVESYVNLFINQLKALASDPSSKEKPIDLEKWFNYLTFDLSGDLSFGSSFSCLATGQTHTWVSIAQDFGKGLSLIASVNQYPPFHKLLRYIIPKKILQRSLDHRVMSTLKARDRLALSTTRPDFVTPTQAYIKQKGISISGAEFEINMLVIAFAASETTASALTAILRELAQHKGVMHRLQTEIRSTFSSEAEITVAATTHLAYLDAVINETLRLDPPVVIGVPRITPPAGAVVCGEYVPGGTYVTYNQFSANRQSYNFRSPNTFMPERFLANSEGDDMKSYQPFGMGRNMCLGMKLAMAELRVTVARLVWGFDVEMKGERWDWGVQKTFILWVSKPDFGGVLDLVMRC
jgi:cytochrome P450